MKKLGWRFISIALSLCLVFQLTSTNAYAMTYRENVVRFIAANGITISGGTFTVTGLCITSGQDPNAQNYVGQNHILNDGEISFNVGRKGSAEVATWFNDRFSGYNNPSVNGDRTTFDHTADNLNFAFLGDLLLSLVLESGSTLEVMFPGVGIAQGSTTFSNNWWFGQLEGQHTRDSDGPSTVLTAGYTTDGRMVYASFLRGGNTVNEISLDAISVVDAARISNQKICNVANQFSQLPIYGTQVNLSGFPGGYDPTVNHIQGYSLYNGNNATEYAVLTHSVSTATYAHIIAGPTAGSDKWGFKTYLKDWRHPGGIQIIGDYLLVPTEQDTEGHVTLYDLRSLAVEELRRVESFDLAFDHKAGALGITSYQADDGTEYYVLIVAHLDGENSIYYVYRSDARGGLENANFEEVGSFACDKDFQGFGLITEAGTNDVYMIGLWSPSEGATFADYAYLYQLDTENWSIGDALENIHLISVGGAVGVLGVHFRYGAGVSLLDDGTFTLSATERNSVLGSSLATNNWTPDTE